MKTRREIIRIILTGGGSAGHVTPLLAIAEALSEANPTIEYLFVGVRQGMETQVVPRKGIKLRYACSRGMPERVFSYEMLRFLVILFFGIANALRILLSFRPKIIIASGGFSSAPSVFAAAVLKILSIGWWRIPVYIHEQNATPGRMNRFAARMASHIGVSHSTALSFFPSSKTKVVGYPVRVSFIKPDRQKARTQLQLSPEDEYLVVFGGSQGARTINRGIIDALPFLVNRPRLHIFHACGTMSGIEYNALEDCRARLQTLPNQPTNYKIVDYAHDLPIHLAAADLVVIRAGAGSLLEICAAGLPAIVIPKANLPGDSQVANARELEKSQAIELFFEEPQWGEEGLIEAVSGEALAASIVNLLDNPQRRATLAEAAKRNGDLYAAQRIAQEVLRLIKKDISQTNIVPLPEPITNSSRYLNTLPTTPIALRRTVENLLNVRWEAAFDHGMIEAEELKLLPDLSYIRYRGAALLVNDNWKNRNEGVKILGLTRHHSKLDLLLKMLTDRTPASPLQRRLGGDFFQVGFIRRNIISALAFLGIWDERVQAAILFALKDPYYEVRSAALRLLRNKADLKCRETLVSAIRHCIADKNLEVKSEALHTFGYYGSPEDVLDAGHAYLLDFRVIVRIGLLRSWQALLSRERVMNDVMYEKLVEEMNSFLLPSVSVQPYFPLKEQYSRIHSMLLNREGS